jgi:hypothetical protein
MRQGLQQWLYGQQPPCRTGLGPSQRISAEPCRFIVSALQREGRAPHYSAVHIVGPGCLRRRPARCDRCERVTRHARQRVLKRRARVIAAAAAEMDCSNRIPRVRATLARVQLPVRLEVEFARELLERAVVTALRGEHEAMKKVQADSFEPSRVRSLYVLRCASGAQLVERCIECLASDEHRGGKPVRQREARAERQHAMRSPEALLAPAHNRKTEVMMPVVRIEHDRLAGGCDRFGRVTASMQHECKRAPRLAG